LNGYGASANIGGKDGIDYTDDSFFGTAFDPRERADIVNTVLVNESYAEWGGVSTTDKVFLLRESQATKKEYGFAQSNTYNDSRKSYNTAYVADGGKTGSTKMSGENWYDRWWLRTPGVITSKESAALYVDGSGGIIDWYDRSLNTADVRDASIAVRPALNLSLDSVLLSSAAEGGKVSGASGAYALAKTGTFIGGAWKLTLLDHAHSSFTVVSSGRTGNEVTASYTGAVTGPNEYISALIKDSEGSVTYYGRIAWASSMSGSVTINVGGKLNSGDTLYLFNEQYNGDRRTDYASPLNELKSIEVLSGALSYKSPAYIGLEVKAIRDGKLNSIYYSVPAGSFRYQWQISPDGASDWTDIEGATTDTYTPKAAEGGKYIRVFAEADGYEGRVYGAALQVEYKMHTVTFDSHGGTAVPSQDLRHGEKAVRPADPTRAGWVFDDWYKNETYTAKFNFDAPVTDDMRAFARWLPPSYTVSFDTDGGSAVASQSVTEGKKVTKPADPTKAGYSFVGWYSNARKTIAFDFDGTPIEANTTIYAKWADLSAKQYNVFFRKDTRTLDNIKVTHGLTVDRPDADRVTFLENIAGGGAVLEGWYADAALTVPFDFENTPITETTSIYGKWLTGHEVFFDTMAGNPTSIYRNVADGQTVKRPAYPEKSGYVFDGWYTDWACTDAYDFSSPVNEDIKLYAKWHKHTLT
ncbi:MAG: InlB B-repeat-containing protein, partial [Clostridia bacterium]|nr:InlB B-repeat-containing protein [Clostridia bacterium]